MTDRPTRRKVEIEITPAMIDAGVSILAERYDTIGGALDRIVAAEIFEAMLAKRVVLEAQKVEVEAS
jgi:cyclopropane fatty-acyl-phospholipid synthase-like methyltransferase